jgi:circadian clock protein KaiB
MAESNGAMDKIGKDSCKKALNSRSTDEFVLHLFVANNSFLSVQAIKNIKDICEKNIPSRYRLDIIDILERPSLARENQIIAAPTLIKESPLPQRRLVGNMSDIERVLTGLGLPSKIG